MDLTSRNCSACEIETEYGTFECYVIKHELSDMGDTIVLKHGGDGIPIVRIHSECMTGDVFHSIKCDCCEQLHKSLNIISRSDFGILIYLRQEGRGIGLFNKIRCYDLQNKGFDTIDANLILGFQADERNYIVAADILHAMNITKIKLITNNPDKVRQIQETGIEIVERIPCIIAPNPHNKHYLETKKHRMGHSI